MNKGFYADINTILDTRAGAIRRINPEVYAELMRNNYHIRKGDFFKGIDQAEFRKLYEAYEVETLMEATITNVFHFLYPQVIDLMKELVAQELQDHQRPVLDVNVWPYDLTQDEMAYLRTIIYGQMRGIIGVNVFSKDIKELTPNHCAEKYHMMIVYDQTLYLNTHSHALIKEPKPFLIMIAPMVYINTDPETDEETIDQLKHGINALSLLERSIAPRLGLRFVNIDVFCIRYPDDRVLEGDYSDNTKQITIEELDKLLVAQKEKRIPEA